MSRGEVGEACVTQLVCNEWIHTHYQMYAYTCIHIHKHYHASFHISTPRASKVHCSINGLENSSSPKYSNVQHLFGIAVGLFPAGVGLFSVTVGLRKSPPPTKKSPTPIEKSPPLAKKVLLRSKKVLL